MDGNVPDPKGYDVQVEYVPRQNRLDARPAKHGHDDGVELDDVDFDDEPAPKPQNGKKRSTGRSASSSSPH